MNGYEAVPASEVQVGDIIAPKGGFQKCEVTMVQKHGLLYLLTYIDLKTREVHATHWSPGVKVQRRRRVKK